MTCIIKLDLDRYEGFFSHVCSSTLAYCHFKSPIAHSGMCDHDPDTWHLESSIVLGSARGSIQPSQGPSIKANTWTANIHRFGTTLSPNSRRGFSKSIRPVRCRLVETRNAEGVQVSRLYMRDGANSCNQSCSCSEH